VIQTHSSVKLRQFCYHTTVTLLQSAKFDIFLPSVRSQFVGYRYICHTLFTLTSNKLQCGVGKRHDYAQMTQIMDKPMLWILKGIGVV